MVDWSTMMNFEIFMIFYLVYHNVVYHLSTLPVRGHRDMGTQVIEVTEFNSEVGCDLRGRLKAAMALRGHNNDCLKQYSNGYQGS